MKLLRRGIFVIVFAFLALLAVTIITNNSQLVDVNMLFMSSNVKLGLALLVAFLIGWSIGIASMFMPWLKRANNARLADKKRMRAEKELDNLRQLPMSDNA